MQPPDLEKYLWVYEFAVGDERAVSRYGLGAVKGVGEAARCAPSSVNARRAAATQVLEDLCRRLDLQKVNRRVLEALIKSGSLDGFAVNRAALMQQLGSAMQRGDQGARAQEAGQVDLFGLAPEERAATLSVTPAPAAPDWSEALRLAGERETLGLYLTGHPIARVEQHLPRFVSHRIGDLLGERPFAQASRGFTAGRSVTVAGLIDEIRKRGARISLSLDDRSGRIEVTLFDEVFQRHRDLIIKDALVLIEGLLRFDEFSDGWRLGARRITDLDQALESQAAAHRSSNGRRSACAGCSLRSWRRFSGASSPGPCPVTIEYRAATASGALTLGPEWSVRPARELLFALEELVGRQGIELRFGAPPTAGLTESLADAGPRP